MLAFATLAIAAPRSLPHDLTPGYLEQMHAEHPLDALSRRLERAVQNGRSIQLSATDLDWLAVAGGYARIQEAATEYIVAQSKARLTRAGHDLSFLKPPSVGTVSTPSEETKNEVAPIEPIAEPDVYSPRTLAERWGVSVSSVHGKIRSGELTAFKLGGHLYRIRRDAVEQYEQRIGIPARRG